jgi:hypothetical protein
MIIPLHSAYTVSGLFSRISTSDNLQKAIKNSISKYRLTEAKYKDDESYKNAVRMELIGIMQDLKNYNSLSLEDVMSIGENRIKRAQEIIQSCSSILKESFEIEVACLRDD